MFRLELGSPPQYFSGLSHYLPRMVNKTRNKCESFQDIYQELERTSFL